MTDFLQEVRGAVYALPPNLRIGFGELAIGAGTLLIASPFLPGDDEPPRTIPAHMKMVGEVDAGLGFWAAGLALIGSGIRDGGLDGILP